MQKNELDIFDRGLKEGRLVHVTTVPNGANCGCICPVCERKLEAVNNIKDPSKLRPYFRHQSQDGGCDQRTYGETKVHYLSKQIIEKRGYITVPKYTYYLNHYYKYYYSLSRELNKYGWDSIPQCIERDTSLYKIYFESIKIEKKQGEIIPDIQVVVEGKPLLIEIAYSHFIEDIKKEYLRKENLNTIEIDLSDLDKDSDIHVIEFAIYNGVQKKVKWIHNERDKNDLKARIYDALDLRDYIFANAKILKIYGKSKRIYKCPLNYENRNGEWITVDGECNSCNYFMSTVGPDNTYNDYMSSVDALELIAKSKGNEESKKVFYKDTGSVECAGHLEEKLNFRDPSIFTSRGGGNDRI